MHKWTKQESLGWDALKYDDIASFQQTRLMKSPLFIRPGDHLTAGTTSRDGATIGSLSSRNEMCEHFVWYYPKTNLGFCMSNYPTEKMLEKFGIEEVEGSDFNPTIVAPPHLANMTYQFVLDNVVQWTPELREERQEAMLTFVQENSCISETGREIVHDITLPSVAEYHPPTECP